MMGNFEDLEYEEFIIDMGNSISCFIIFRLFPLAFLPVAPFKISLIVALITRYEDYYIGMCFALLYIGIARIIRNIVIS